MKSILKVTLVTLLAALASLASATQTGTKLSLAMELKEGETIVAKPRLVVMAGKPASVRIDSDVAGAVANGTAPHQWKVDIVPTLAGSGEVSTNFNVTFSSSAADGYTRKRTMTVETLQKLGQTAVIQIPGHDGDQPLSVSLTTNLIAD